MLQAAGISIRQAFRASPAIAVGVVAMTVLSGLAPLLTLWVAKGVLDSAARFLTSGRDPTVIRELLFFVLLQLAIGLLASALRAYGMHLSTLLSRTMTIKMQHEIIHRCLELDLSFFESAEAQNVLMRAQGAGVTAVSAMLQTLLSMGSAFITVVGAIIALTYFSPWMALVACAVGVPNYWLNSRLSRKRYAVAKSRSERGRRSGYLFSLLTMREQVRNTKLFGLGNHFAGLWMDTESLSLSEETRVRAEQAWYDVVLSGLASLGNAAAYVWTAFVTLDLGGSIGTLMMNVGLFSRAAGQVQGLADGIARMFEHSVFADDYVTLMNTPSSIEVQKGGIALHGPVESIEFKDVSFAYPGTKYTILDNVNLRIERGDHVVLIGRNGAGKSTIIKLLVRLYDPTSGVILINGRDIREYSTESLRKGFGVLLQDYACYFFSVRENVRLGDHEAAGDDAAVHRSLSASGFSQVLPKLPDGLESVLGRIFGGNADLSTGEWQKLALSRVLFRNPSVYVLDEPTSSLDEKSELEVLRTFKHHTEGKIAIIVSHRRAARTLADRVLTIEDGILTEDSDETHHSDAETSAVAARAGLA